jgi:hypothetical protein
MTSYLVLGPLHRRHPWPNLARPHGNEEDRAGAAMAVHRLGARHTHACVTRELGRHIGLDRAAGVSPLGARSPRDGTVVVEQLPARAVVGQGRQPDGGHCTLLWGAEPVKAGELGRHVTGGTRC